MVTVGNLALFLAIDGDTILRIGSAIFLLLLLATCAYLEIDERQVRRRNAARERAQELREAQLAKEQSNAERRAKEAEAHKKEELRLAALTSKERAKEEADKEAAFRTGATKEERIKAETPEEITGIERGEIFKRPPRGEIRLNMNYAHMTPEQRIGARRIVNAVIYGIITIALVVGAAISIYRSSNGWAIALGILAMIFGSTTFDQFDQPEAIKPIDMHHYEDELFSSALKSGAEVNVHLEINFKGSGELHYMATRIKNQLQRALNIYLSAIVELSADPYSEIDRVIQCHVEVLAKELSLTTISVQTIRVMVQGQHHTPQGLYLAGR